MAQVTIARLRDPGCRESERRHAGATGALSNILYDLTLAAKLIHRRVSEGRDGTLEDCLQPGYKQMAAGYVMYGSSTVLVYTTGQGVAGITLDPSIGEFLPSHREIRIPEPGKQ